MFPRSFPAHAHVVSKGRKISMADNSLFQSESRSFAKRGPFNRRCSEDLERGAAVRLMPVGRTEHRPLNLGGQPQRA